MAAAGRRRMPFPNAGPEEHTAWILWGSAPTSKGFFCCVFFFVLSRVLIFGEGHGPWLEVVMMMYSIIQS